MTAPTPNAMPGAAAPVQPAAPAPEAPQQPPPEAPATAPLPTQSDSRPPWEKAGVEFDPEKAWQLIQNVKGELNEYKTRTDPIVAEREQLRRASMEDNERLAEDLSKSNEREQTWRTQAISAKAEALASTRFVDTETALALIGDLSQYVTGDAIDTTKLMARLDQLAADKPFLVAAPPQPPGFTPNRAQGQAGTGGAMPLDAQIRAAEKSGDFGASIALKQQRYHQNQQNRS
jgi:hypothetical protein